MFPVESRLLISYRSNEDEVTERVISDIVLEPPHLLHAYCHLRNEGRSFALKRIDQAIDLMTGEEIADIWVYVGLPSGKPAAPQMPEFRVQPLSMSTAESRNLRKADKQALFRRFRFDVVAEAYRAKLWALFGDRCFRCKACASLELDHHIPQYLGGRLVPGNVVLLCARCNSAKRDTHPSEFYSAEQLAVLDPILHSELALFDFQFDWARWNAQPKNYLISLGVPEALAEAALYDPTHPFYVRGASDNE